MRHFVLSRYLLASTLLMAAGAATEAAATTHVVPKRLSAPVKELLLKVAAADQQTGLVIDETSAEAKTLLKAGWLYTDNTKRDGNNVPAILSPDGKAKVESFKASTPSTPRGPQLSPEDFTIDTDVPMPDFTTTRRAPRQIYPFEKLLAVGNSFFIPQPEAYDGKDFAQSKSGTISAQNKKAKEAWDAIPADAEGKPEKPVFFKVVNDTKDGVKGARVFRTA